MMRPAVLLAVLALSLGVVACGETGDEGGLDPAANRIEEDADNRGVEITIGSKNFTEQYILGEIYAQALAAAGYDVETRLDLGSEKTALRALERGEIDAYPEYASTALTSFFHMPAQKVPADGHEAWAQTHGDFAGLGLIAYPPTPFSSANAVGLLTETADELDVTKVSELQGISRELTLSGSPECRRRIDCLVGLQRNYELKFKRFDPVEIGRRYEMLAERRTDLSILFTTDAQLFVSDEFVILEDDRHVLPAGNVLFVAREATAQEAGADFGATIESVQENLTLETVQELNARVDVDREQPADVAEQYLKEFGYVS
jgi:osmoprotectant transport system substrate-binding protein